jgi:hypothetical protein
MTDDRERTAGNPGTTVDYRNNTENNREMTVNNCEQIAEESFDDYRSKATSSSEYSSIKSLEELLSDLMNTDIYYGSYIHTAIENINFI